MGGFGWGILPGLNGYLEMRAWASAGIPLETIFRAETVDNAKAFGLAEQLGTIELGKRAGLLLLAENPLSDVSAYDTIEVVIVGGYPVFGGHPVYRQALSASQITSK